MLKGWECWAPSSREKLRSRGGTSFTGETPEVRDLWTEASWHLGSAGHPAFAWLFLGLWLMMLTCHSNEIPQVAFIVLGRVHLLLQILWI